MKTIRAKELIKNQIIIESNNDRLKVSRVDVTKRGNIMLWTGPEGATLKFYNPMDVLVIE